MFETLNQVEKICEALKNHDVHIMNSEVWMFLQYKWEKIYDALINGEKRGISWKVKV